MNSATTREPRRINATGIALSACALLLALNLINGAVGVPGPTPALAARGERAEGKEPAAFPNAAEQRERMIRAIEALDSRMKSIESRLGKGPIEVKVTEMPSMVAPGTKE